MGSKITKKILFISALNSELKIVKEQVKKNNIFKNLEIDFLLCWMGNYNTIYNLTKFLEKNKIDFIVNIWVCGYKKDYEKLIQVWRIKNISNNKELIIPNFINFSKISSLYCSEKIIFDKENILEENFVDMESFWVEFVSEKYNIPRIILKIPVDKIWEETKNFDFEKAKKFLSENIDYKKLLEEINNFLEKNIILENKNIEKFLKKLNFSESQKIIFEKLYNKYEVLVWDNFEDFLKSYFKKFEDKKIEKKDLKNFLKYLEEFLEGK